MEFQAHKLPFSYSEYEPYISAEIMELHYSKHYFGYLAKLNAAVAKYPKLSQCTIEGLLMNVSKLPEDIRSTVQNNGGGASNHELLWKILNPKNPQQPSESFLSVIKEGFESFDSFKEKVFELAQGLFGSGWVWLALDTENKLKLYTLPNQNSPHIAGEIPIFGIDLWEHSYYLQFKNVRGDYLKSIWKIIDWSKVEQLFQEAKSSCLDCCCHCSK